MSEPLNPYAPPREAAPQAAAAPAFARPRQLVLYESAEGKARVAQGTAVALLILRLIFAVSLVLEINLYRTLQATADVAQAIPTTHGRHQSIALVVALAMLVNFIALLVWTYAAFANLEAFGARNLSFTSGWAIGSYFIPIANFWKPYQALLELWRCSDPSLARGWGPRPATLLTVWWVLWAIAAIGNRVITWSTLRAGDLDTFTALSTLALLIVLVVETPMSVCQILLIGRLQQFQNEHVELLLLQPDNQATNPKRFG